MFASLHIGIAIAMFARGGAAQVRRIAAARRIALLLHTRPALHRPSSPVGMSFHDIISIRLWKDSGALQPLMKTATRKMLSRLLLPIAKPPPVWETAHDEAVTLSGFAIKGNQAFEILSGRGASMVV